MVTPRLVHLFLTYIIGFHHPPLFSYNYRAGHSLLIYLTICSVDVSHTMFGMLLGAAMVVPKSGASERS